MQKPYFLFARQIIADIKKDKLKQLLKPEQQNLLNNGHSLARLSCGHFTIISKNHNRLSFCKRCRIMWYTDRYRYGEFLESGNDWLEWADDPLVSIHERTKL